MIGSGIGLAALIVLVLAIARGVQRRTDLFLAVADVMLLFGIAFDEAGERAYRTGRRRTMRFVDDLSERAFAIGWGIERWALGQYHFFPGRYSPSAASPVTYYDDDLDELYAIEDEVYFGTRYED